MKFIEIKDNYNQKLRLIPLDKVISIYDHGPTFIQIDILPDTYCKVECTYQYFREFLKVVLMSSDSRIFNLELFLKNKESMK